MAYKGTITSLTPEQQKEFDGLSKAERLLFLEELELMREMEGNQKVDAPSTEDIEKKEDELQAKPSESEVKVSGESKDQDSTPESEENDEKSSLDYWKKQAEIAEKRRRDGERHLTPVMQENAQLRKEKESLLSRLEKLENSLSEIKNSKNDSLVEDGDDFDESYPDVAKKIKKEQQQLEKRIKAEVEARLSEIHGKHKSLEEAATFKERQEFAANHLLEVKKVHEDTEDFFLEHKNGPAFVEWAKTQPPLVYKVVTEPLSFDPADVAYAITQFKLATKMSSSKPSKKPAMGDIVAKAVSSPSRIADPSPEPDVFPSAWTDKDFNEHIHKLNRFHAKDPQKLMDVLDAEIEKWERTISKRN